MKNLIITLGLILLMIQGMIHDGDSMTIMKKHLQLRSLCCEMADAAASVMESGGSPEAAKNYAEEILQRNSENEMEWEIEIMDNTITVKVRTGEIYLQSPGQDRPLHLTYQIERNLIS